MEKSIYSENYDLFLTLLRRAREQAGLTQVALAAKLNETQTFVSKCERGERRLDVVELREWCHALGVELHEFMKQFDSVCHR